MSYVYPYSTGVATLPATVPPIGRPVVAPGPVAVVAPAAVDGSGSIAIWIIAIIIIIVLIAVLAYVIFFRRANPIVPFQNNTNNINTPAAMNNLILPTNNGTTAAMNGNCGCSDCSNRKRRRHHMRISSSSSSENDRHRRDSSSRDDSTTFQSSSDSGHRYHSRSGGRSSDRDDSTTFQSSDSGHRHHSQNNKDDSTTITTIGSSTSSQSSDSSDITVPSRKNRSNKKKKHRRRDSSSDSASTQSLAPKSMTYAPSNSASRTTDTNSSRNTIASFDTVTASNKSDTNNRDSSGTGLGTQSSNTSSGSSLTSNKSSFGSSNIPSGSSFGSSNSSFSCQPASSTNVSTSTFNTHSSGQSTVPSTSKSNSGSSFPSSFTFSSPNASNVSNVPSSYSSTVTDQTRISRVPQMSFAPIQSKPSGSGSFTTQNTENNRSGSNVPSYVDDGESTISMSPTLTLEESFSVPRGSSTRNNTIQSDNSAQSYVPTDLDMLSDSGETLSCETMSQPHRGERSIYTNNTFSDERSDLSVADYDVLSNPMNEASKQSLWIGAVSGRNASLRKAGYGFLTPFLNNEKKLEYPIIDAVAVDSRENFDILYVHVKNPMIQGVYGLNTGDTAPMWVSLIGTNQSRINSLNVIREIDRDEKTTISSMYCRNGKLYLITATAVYMVDGSNVQKLSSNGSLSRDHYGNLSVEIRNNGDLKVGKNLPSLPQYTRTSAIGSVSCLGKDSYLAMLEKGGLTYVGYGNENHVEIGERCIAANGNVNGAVCLVTPEGRVKLTSPKSNSVQKEFIGTIDLRKNIHVAVGSNKFYVFST